MEVNVVDDVDQSRQSEDQEHLSLNPAVTYPEMPEGSARLEESDMAERQDAEKTAQGIDAESNPDDCSARDMSAAARAEAVGERGEFESSAVPSSKSTGRRHIGTTEREKPRSNVDETATIHLHQVANPESSPTFSRLAALHQPSESIDTLVETRFRWGLRPPVLEVVLANRSRTAHEKKYRPLLTNAADVAAMMRVLPVGAQITVFVHRRNPFASAQHELLAALLTPTPLIDAGVRAVAIHLLKEHPALRDTIPRILTQKEVQKIVGVSHPVFGARRKMYGREIRKILGLEK